MEALIPAIFQLFIKAEAIITREPSTIVQYGIARFPGSGERPISSIIDEPIAIISVLYQLGGWDRLVHYLRGHFAESAVFSQPGVVFESVVALQLLHHLGGEGKKLDEIFKFPLPDGPSWKSQLASLRAVVKLEMPDESGSNYRFCSVSETSGAGSVYGFSASKISDVQTWFDNPSSPILFPDSKMGPDLVFIIQLEDGTKKMVLIQCKLAKAFSLKGALGTLTPSLFWCDNVCALLPSSPNLH